MGVVLVLPIPGLMELVLLIKNSRSLPCRIECLKKKQFGNLSNDLCTKQCEYLAIKYCNDFLEAELKKCKWSKEPEKCRKKIFKLLFRWKPIYQKAKLDLEFSMKKQKHLNKENYTLEENVQPPETNPQLQKILTMGLAIASLPVPIPGLIVAIAYLTDINMYKCGIRCERDDTEKNKDLCYKRCKALATKWSTLYIEKELRKCPATKDPNKCRKKLFKLLMDYKKRQAKEEAMYKFKERELRYKGTIK
jgi:hypothetical protein